MTKFSAAGVPWPSSASGSTSALQRQGGAAQAKGHGLGVASVRHAAAGAADDRRRHDHGSGRRHRGDPSAVEPAEARQGRRDRDRRSLGDHQEDRGAADEAPSELAANIRNEAEHHIPFGRDDVEIDYHVTNPMTASGQTELLLVAAKKEVVADYVAGRARRRADRRRSSTSPRSRARTASRPTTRSIRARPSC